MDSDSSDSDIPMASTARERQAVQATRCYLLELPPELRLRIYEYVCYTPQQHIINCFLARPGRWNIDPHQPEELASCLPLLRTCHIINHEAKPVVYDNIEHCVIATTPVKISRSLLKRPEQLASTIYHVSLSVPAQVVIAAALQPLDEVCAMLELAPRHISVRVFTIDYDGVKESKQQFAGILQEGAKSRGIDLTANTVTAAVWSSILQRVEEDSCQVQQRREDGSISFRSH